MTHAPLVSPIAPTEPTASAQGAMATLDDDAIRDARRLCFFAHYHPRGIVSECVLAHLRALADAGFTVVVASTADLPDAEQGRLRAAVAQLVMRENVGLDFGGWIELHRRFAPRAAEFLLLANDSVYAPFGDLGAFVDRLTAVPADFYGAVESLETGVHLQSWFLLLRPAAFASPAFRRLLSEPVPPELTKPEIIRRYELGLTRSLLDAGLRHHAAYRATASGPIARGRPFNPMLLLWDVLVERYGIPFLKIELLRDNPRFARGLRRWRTLARRGPPGLADAIDADLEGRGARGPVRARDAWRWSTTFGEPVYWPELRHFVARDSVARSTALRRWNAVAFRAAAWAGRRVRRRATGAGATR